MSKYVFKKPGNFREKHEGFSLAELLITFLIVALIASIVSANIVKNKVKMNSAHNYWACTRDENGDYHLSTSDSKTGS